MRRFTRIIILTAVALPLLAVAFYIRYRPELEDRFLPPIIVIKSPLNGSILKDTRAKVELCCERIRTRGYSLTVNLNGNRINHKLGVRGSCFSGIVKCDSGYNHLGVELYRQNRLLNHAASRFTVSPIKTASREKLITKPTSGQEPTSAPGSENTELQRKEKVISETELTVAEAPTAPTGVSRTGDEGEGAGGLMIQDRAEEIEEAGAPEPPPVELFITIEAPVCGSLTNQSVQDVGGNATPGMQVALVNPRTSDLLVTSANNSGEYLFPSVNFNEGMNQIAVTVSDAEGRTKDASCSLLVDTNPPLITIDNPKDTSIHSSLKLNVYGATEPNILVEIVEPYTSSQSDGLGNFRFSQVTFNEGSNSFTVKATDSCGNIGTETVNFKIDTKRPEISCERPKELECSNSVDINCKTEPNCTVELLDQSLKTTSDPEGNFIFPNVGPFPEGENTIKLRATDPAGNTFDIVLTFVVDTTSPMVTLTNPRDGSIINPRIQDITGKTEPFCSVEISAPLSGERITVMSNEEGIFVFPGVSFPEGPNTLTVEATDRCGWEGSSIISFFAEPDFYRVTTDFCDSLKNPIDSSEVTQFTKCVYVNLPDEGRSLGAYHLFISYDPEVVRLRRVSGGDAVEFSSVSSKVDNTPDPETDLATSFFFEANNGRTNWTAPSGMGINVAKLTFDVINSGTSPLALRIRTLSDNNRQSISGFAKNGFVEVK
jgi:hypothetical protein